MAITQPTQDPQSHQQVARLRPTSSSLDLWSLLVVVLTISLTIGLTEKIGPGPALGIAALFLTAMPFLEFNPTWALATREMSFYLALPILISATQNVYLGIAAPSLSASNVQTLLILNVLLAGIYALLFGPLSGTTSKIRQQIGVVVLGTMAWAIVTYGLFGGDFQTALASLRNLLNPALFAYLGLVLAPFVVLRRLLIYIAWIAVVVIAFGFYEKFVDQSVWVSLHIADLWDAKGLPINPFTGLPGNFYSSESIGGHIVRRMTSTFADPVNLGTFLFLAFAVAWYLRWSLLSVLAITAMVFTVSKGALLGLLVFGVVRARHSKTAVLAFPLVVGASVFIGVALITYSLANSTQSLTAHVDGFTNAFQQLPGHPLGNGLGRVGVLANIQDAANGDSTGSIAESGLGLLVGQLGIVGLSLFAYLCWRLRSALVKLEGARERTLGLGLLYAIIVNIAFNEVALSPNSSAGYFMILGILAASSTTVASST